MDMDEIPDLMKKIHDTHGIEFLDYDISFKGICQKCRGGGKGGITWIEKQCIG